MKNCNCDVESEMMHCWQIRVRLMQCSQCLLSVSSAAVEHGTVTSSQHRSSPRHWSEEGWRPREICDHTSVRSRPEQSLVSSTAHHLVFQVNLQVTEARKIIFKKYLQPLSVVTS